LQVRLVVKRFYPFSKIDKPVKTWFRWIVLYLGLQLFLFVPPLVILRRYGDEDFFWMLFLPASLGALSMAIAVLLNPWLAYGIESKPEGEKPAIKPKALPDSEFVAQTSLRLEQYLEANKPFLKQGYTLKELADETGMPVHQLSGFINQVMGKNFSDLMNQYRIIYCQHLFQNGEANNLNLHGLALKCGFSNRNTFTIAFKKNTGFTPSQYLKKLQDDKSVTKAVKRRMVKKQKRSIRKP
jgi:AraC-like DNA-binding protein